MEIPKSRKSDRIKSLTNVLQGQIAIHISEAAELLDVSEMTIRRDIANNPDGLSLMGGYVTRDISAQRNEIGKYLVSAENGRNTEEKRRIGKLAAALVQKGDTIFFDCGSTTPFVIDFIPTDLEFTAVCNSLNVFLKLQEKPNCNLILCGGTYYREDMVFEYIGAQVLDTIRFSKAFISAGGVSDRFGITCFNLHEVPAKTKVMQNSQTNILLADHTKLDKVRAAYIADLDRFDFVISDKPLPNAYTTLLLEHDAHVVTDQ